MKFTELKKQIKEGNDFKESIAFKPVSLPSQRKMINEIKSFCIIEDENGLVKVDYIFKELFKLLYVTINFTDITFAKLYDEEGNINPKLSFEIYDVLMANQIDEYLFGQPMISRFIIILESEIKQEVTLRNGLGVKVTNMLNGLIGKLPTEENVKNMLQELPVALSQLGKLSKTKKP